MSHIPWGYILGVLVGALGYEATCWALRRLRDMLRADDERRRQRGGPYRTHLPADADPRVEARLAITLARLPNGLTKCPRCSSGAVRVRARHDDAVERQCPAVRHVHAKCCACEITWPERVPEDYGRIRT